ncbi:unnamed protein product [Cylindrotheca closterium]|uniref:Trichome birefringence-like C-terminal domain-containing protein n=1 Tax=Cylindrotheca closterium TaxID=2856 RepID=A0AAD2G9Z0_9STRA|nr:unnamed protein product [Cylindrotheca closterium]
MFVGDSLTWEHYRTLVEILGGKTATLLQFRSKHRYMTIVQPVCDHQQTFIMYRREDSLKGLDLYLEEKFPVVLILNRGAHYAPDDTFSADLKTTFQHVSSWQQKCNEYGVRCYFFWRTSVPGHPGCNNFTGPVNNLTLMEEILANNRDSPGNWRWEEFKHQNELALQLLDNSSVTDYDVIDAYPINMLRPDQHARPYETPGKGVDCLHSCRPGKMDVYNRLLQHFLIQRRSFADVQALENFTFPWIRTTNVQADGHDIIY